MVIDTGWPIRWVEGARSQRCRHFTHNTGRVIESTSRNHIHSLGVHNQLWHIYDNHNKWLYVCILRWSKSPPLSTYKSCVWSFHSLSTQFPTGSISETTPPHSPEAKENANLWVLWFLPDFGWEDPFHVDPLWETETFTPTRRKLIIFGPIVPLPKLRTPLPTTRESFQGGRGSSKMTTTVLQVINER